MFTKTYNVQFDGYFLESDINSLPAESGIYGIYTCIHNRNDTVTLGRLIYIGESHNARQRVENHIKWSSWKRRLKNGEKLCFNVALICPKRDRKRVEAALIYKHQPAGNAEHLDEPPMVSQQ